MAQPKKPRTSRQPNGASTIYLGKDGRWHGRVTVGVKDDGSPDRRHVGRKTRAEVTKVVRELERQRDAGGVRKAGQHWTVQTWLTHWVENIAAPSVGEYTIDGYRVAVYRHLIPGLGAHRLEKLEPEHIERLYKKMQESGSAAGTAHQAHRTLNTSLNEAVRRRHITLNPVSIAKAPKLEEEEVEPYTVEEVQRLLLEAEKHRNTARWVIALALGLRQGEVLGLKWEDVHFDAGVIRVRQSRLRPRYKHGCGNRCGRKPGYCPQKINTRKETKGTKSKAGKRPIGVPEELLKLLRLHKEEQDRERVLARDLWVEKGYVFTSPVGEPLNPNTDYHRWKDLLKAAGVRDGRLHDARHTAATVLLILGVPDAVVDRIMGWEPGNSARMRRRYQHLTGRVLRDTAAEDRRTAVACRHGWRRRQGVRGSSGARRPARRVPPPVQRSRASRIPGGTLARRTARSDGRSGGVGPAEVGAGGARWPGRCPRPPSRPPRRPSRPRRLPAGWRAEADRSSGSVVGGRLGIRDGPLQRPGGAVEHPSPSGR